MAEFNAFSIGIGADITVLQTELQRAKNLLAQFESASRKALTVGELNYSNSQISNLKNVIAQLNTEINKTGKPIGDATQSLVNFSRIAQDAPYGIQGIANNLNPMLESFQRLAATEKGTKNAFNAMIEGLSGPAGIGVMLGIASSLLVVFSKQISAAFDGTADKLKDLREELKKLNEDVYKITGAAQSAQTKGGILAGIISNKDVDLKTRQEALKQFKSLYSDSKEAQDLEIKSLEKYNLSLLNSINNRSAIQKDALGKEKNYTDALNAANATYKKLIDERDKLKDRTLATTSQLEKGITTDYLRGQIDAKYVKPLKEAQKDIDRAKSSLGETISNVLQFETPDEKGGTKKEKKDPFTEITKDFQRSLNAQEILRSKSLIDQQTYLDNTYKIYDEYIKKLAGLDTKKATDKIESLLPKFDKMTFEKNAKDIKDGINKVLGSYEEKPLEEPKDTAIEDAKKAQINYGKWYASYLKGIQKLTKNNYDEKKDLTEKEKKDQEDLAESISNNVTNAFFGMYDAIQSGESVIDSLGNMLRRVTEQLIEAALQAAIFAGIMSIVSGGVAGGGLSFVGYFKKAFGLAEGGIVTGPTHALIGEGNESEAVLPLSKLSGMLNTTFNAGAMNSGSGGQNGQFVLRGQDLLLSINRAQKASNLKGQNISLA